MMEISFKFLQNSTITAEEAFNCLDRLHIRLHDLRSDQEFDKIYENVKNLVNNDVDEPQPFKRKIKELAASSQIFLFTTNFQQLI